MYEFQRELIRWAIIDLANELECEPAEILDRLKGDLISDEDAAKIKEDL